MKTNRYKILIIRLYYYAFEYLLNIVKKVPDFLEK